MTRLSNATLLVIDFQNDFVAPGGVVEIKEIRRNLGDYAKFIDTCRAAGVLVIYTRHNYTPENNPIEKKLFPQLENDGLRPGSTGWEIYDVITPKGGDTIVDKTRYDAFFKTNLKEILDDHDIKTVIITGTMTDVCCESTARTAMHYDYDVIFCSDMTYCADPVSHDNTLKVISSHFGKVMSSNAIVKEFQNVTPKSSNRKG
ncbi:MAG: hypothetical protein UY63_C0002G0021 [Parcubacteria group bacterium GW2011_GWA2_51_10]|nr:MAG: hypothetical protein UY63_C0002G0021 [Parcubacteria group bacterium GW2011_GWA2_51_10]